MATLSYLNEQVKYQFISIPKSAWRGACYFFAAVFLTYGSPLMLEGALPKINIVDYRYYGQASGVVMLVAGAYVFGFVCIYYSRSSNGGRVGFLTLLTAPAFIWAFRRWISAEKSGPARFVASFLDFRRHEYFYHKMSIVYLWLFWGLLCLFAVEHVEGLPVISKSESVNIKLSFWLCAVLTVLMIIVSRISVLHDILWFGSQKLAGHEALLQRHDHVASGSASTLEGVNMVSNLGRDYHSQADEIAELEVMLAEAIKSGDEIEERSIAVLITQIKEPLCKSDFDARLRRADIDRYN